MGSSSTLTPCDSSRMHACPKYRQRAPSPSYFAYGFGASVVRKERKRSASEELRLSASPIASSEEGSFFIQNNVSSRSLAKGISKLMESPLSTRGVLRTNGRSSPEISESITLCSD